MEKSIEILAFLMKDENLLYSILILVVANFIGGLVVFVWNLSSQQLMNHQLKQEKKHTESIIKVRDGLLDEQKNDQKRIEGLQDKLRQSTESLMESEKQQTEFELRSLELNNALSAKQRELDELNGQLSDLSANGQKIIEIEEEAIQLAKDLDFVKQQLKQQDDDLNNKNKQIEAFEADDHSVIVEQNAKVVDLENIIQQNNQRLSQSNDKLQLLLSQQPSAIQANQSVAESTTQENGFFGRMMGLVSSLDNDENKNSHHNKSADDINTQALWQRHQTLMDQLNDQFGVRNESIEVADDDKEEKAIFEQVEELIEERVEEAIDERVEERIEIPDEVAEQTQDIEYIDNPVMPTISDEVADMMKDATEAVGFVQTKLKGFYQKIVS